MESLQTGTLAGIGSFRCESCDYVLSLAAEDRLPPCPSCAGESWARASLFSSRLGDHSPPADESLEESTWVDAARAGIPEAGQYLAYDDDGSPVVFALSREWTRIGRSLAADVRFDDPTVSRRHALIVRQADGVRVLDDRSLNGVFVNGKRVEWSALADGDEVLVGRHALRFLDVTAPIAAASSEAGTEPVAS